MKVKLYWDGTYWVADCLNLPGSPNLFYDLSKETVVARLMWHVLTNEKHSKHVDRNGEVHLVYE